MLWLDQQKFSFHSSGIMSSFRKSFHHFKCGLTQKRGDEHFFPFFPFCVLASEFVSSTNIFWAISFEQALLLKRPVIQQNNYIEYLPRKVQHWLLLYLHSYSMTFLAQAVLWKNFHYYTSLNSHFPNLFINNCCILWKFLAQAVIRKNFHYYTSLNFHFQNHFINNCCFFVLTVISYSSIVG